MCTMDTCFHLLTYCQVFLVRLNGLCGVGESRACEYNVTHANVCDT